MPRPDPSSPDYQKQVVRTMTPEQVKAHAAQVERRKAMIASVLRLVEAAQDLRRSVQGGIKVDVVKAWADLFESLDEIEATEVLADLRRFGR